MAGPITVPIARAMKRMTLTVKITGVRTWRARVWLGAQIFRLGALVMGCNFRVDLDG